MIVSEFENSDLTRQEIAEKYGIRCPSSISNWKKILESTGISVPLYAKPKSNNAMDSKKPQTPPDEKRYSTTEEELEALRAELVLTRSRLAWQEKRTLALETLIEVAEEHGMPIKKCGAKQ